MLLHTQRLHKSIWQDACGVGSRDGLELRSSYSYLSVSPSFNHQVAISRGAKGVLVGKHGTLLRTLTQMDPWTVCRLLLMDDICSGGGGGEFQRQTDGPRVSFIFILVLIHEGPLPKRTLHSLFYEEATSLLQRIT